MWNKDLKSRPANYEFTDATRNFVSSLAKYIPIYNVGYKRNKRLDILTNIVIIYASDFVSGVLVSLITSIIELFLNAYKKINTI